MIEFFVDHYAHVSLSILIGIGFFGMVAKRNLIKKLIGMSILQASIILFWIVTAEKDDATIPIIRKGDGAVDPTEYVNPLPHALMLTAIVVSVVTSGVAIALLVKVYRNYGSLEEKDVLGQM
ncbi:MAG: cation:proton antiporter subunit C [Planctomycetota bacterium]